MNSEYDNLVENDVMNLVSLLIRNVSMSFLFLKAKATNLEIWNREMLWIVRLLQKTRYFVQEGFVKLPVSKPFLSFDFVTKKLLCQQKWFWYCFFNVPLQKEYIYVKNIPGIDYSPGYVLAEKTLYGLKQVPSVSLVSP